MVLELAPRLAEVERVDRALAQLSERGKAGADPSTLRSLHGGYPGLAICFAELGRVDAHWRTTGHRYLELALRQGNDPGQYGQLEGHSAVATAASMSARDPSDYEQLLRRLDQQVVSNAGKLVAMQQDVQDQGLPTRPILVDALYGLAGVGRQLLAREAADDRSDGALRDVLDRLAALRKPLLWQGEQVPGWWYRPSDVVNDTDDDFGEGFVGLGLSHGMAGPLALLALAWRAGARVDGQADAMATMVTWLLERCEHADGLYWPAWISLAELRDPAQDQPARLSLVGWCHGSLGIAHAAALAGNALGEKHWTARADEVAGDVLRIAGADWSSVRDAGLCHGLAGLLHQLSHLSWRNAGVAGLEATTDQVAQLLLDRYDPAATFGFRHRDPRTGDDYDAPGLFDGSAGILLALHAYASGQPPATGWDRIFLLS